MSNMNEITLTFQEQYYYFTMQLLIIEFSYLNLTEYCINIATRNDFGKKIYKKFEYLSCIFY